MADPCNRMQVRGGGTRGQHITVCASSVARSDHPPCRTAYTVTGRARTVMNQTQSKHSFSQRALVDRGANGGIAGPNMQLISWTEGTVDTHGIDNHRVSAVLTWRLHAVQVAHESLSVKVIEESLFI